MESGRTAPPNRSENGALGFVQFQLKLLQQHYVAVEQGNLLLANTLHRQFRSTLPGLGRIVRLAQLADETDSEAQAVLLLAGEIRDLHSRSLGKLNIEQMKIVGLLDELRRGKQLFNAYRSGITGDKTRLEIEG